MIPTSLGPHLEEIPDSPDWRNTWELDLSQLRIFSGLSILSRSLGDEIIDRVQNFPGDISLFHKLNPNLNAELIEMHIGYIQIYARAGILKDVLLFPEEFHSHLRTVFGTFQRPVWARKIHPEFYGEDPRSQKSIALVFPFHHSSTNEKVDYQFILERVPNQTEPQFFFFRLTIENEERAKIDLASIPHSIVDDLGSRVYIEGSTRISESITNSVISASQRGETSLIEEYRSFSRVFEQIAKTPIGSLLQINLYWEKTFSEFCLRQDPREILPFFKKIFLIFEDQSSATKLKSGAVLKVVLGKFFVCIDLSRLDRVLNISFNQKRTTVDLGYYLSRMPKLEDFANQKTHKLDFQKTNVFLIHHITSEILALIEAFFRTRVGLLEVAFVKYGGTIPPAYLEVLLDIPVDSFYMSGLELRVSAENKTFYNISPLYSDTGSLKPLWEKMEEAKLGFFDAMRLLSGHRFLLFLQKAKRLSQKVILVEDGGYIAPFFNEYALKGLSVREVAKLYHLELEENGSFSDFLCGVMIASVEHTRNGYDRLLKVRDQGKKLFLPAYSIAISHQKTKEESREVAHSILKAIEGILHGQGKILSSRKILLLGADGNIGTFLSKYIRNASMHESNDHLVKVDLKFSPHPDRLEFTHLNQIPEQRLLDTDLILGVIGESIFTPEFLEKLVVLGIPKNVYFVSGSTKTAEFTHLLEWLDGISRNKGILIPSCSRTEGISLNLSYEKIIDPQSGMYQGRIAVFREQNDTGKVHKKLFLLSDLSPINFLYYGVPTEGMDPIITNLAQVSLALFHQHSQDQLPVPDLYAVDHQIDQWGNPL